MFLFWACKRREKVFWKGFKYSFCTHHSEYKGYNLLLQESGVRKSFLAMSIVSADDADYWVELKKDEEFEPLTTQTALQTRMTRMLG